jgi:hypothetical protein
VLAPIAIGSWRGAIVGVGLGGAHGALLQIHHIDKLKEPLDKIITMTFTMPVSSLCACMCGNATEA